MAWCKLDICGLCALNGLAIVIERVLGIGKRSGKKNIWNTRLEKAAKIIAFEDIRFSCRPGAHGAYLCFICGTWVFFRAQSIDQALYMLPRFLEGFDTFNLKQFLGTRIILGLDHWEFFTAIGSIILLELVHIFQSFASPSRVLARMPVAIRLVTYAVCLSIVIWFAWTESQTFIYFAF